MRIGVFLGRLDPSDGGAHTYAATVINGVQFHGARHEFVFFSYGDVPVASSEGHRSIQLQAPKRTRSLASRLAGSRRRKHRQRHDPGPLNAAAVEQRIELMWFPTLAWEHVDAPFIYTIWDLQHRLQSFFPEVSVAGYTFQQREAGYAHICPRAAAIIVPNLALKQEVQLFYGVPADRIVTLAQPTPDFALAHAGSVAGGPAPTLAQGYLFYPAQFWPHKNHVGLLHALKLLKEHHQLRPRLILTGSDKGNLAHVRATADRLGVLDQVEFGGFVSQQRLVELYRGAFALVFPSFFGPENLPPLEAFALGCPVVAAQVSGAEYQLGNAALLFNPRDETQICAQLLRLEREPDLRRALVSRGLDRARACTGREFAAGLLAVIDDFAPIRRCWSTDSPYVHT